MVAQIASTKVLHGHVEELSVLEVRFHVDDEGVAEFFEDGLFVDDWGDALLENDSGWEEKYFAFEIYFMARISPVFFYCTFHTRPKPPEPTWYSIL